MHTEPVALSRDCEATEIPSGRSIVLRAGMSVRVTQAAGGAFTVMTELGQMASIASKDADALGREPLHEELTGAPGEGSLEESVETQLKTCFDPEIPINIVDLGLVYERCVTALEGGGHRVEIRMTLTAPGCGMGEWLSKDVQMKLMKIPGVKEVDVQLVWDPPWTRALMSEAAKLELGLM